jgi:DNA-directed RNA polymerase specialized sigma24 family protein
VIKTETDPLLIKKLQQKNMDSIIDWFEQRKTSLYKLASVYIRKTEDIQEIFYNVMVKVQAEIHKKKKQAPFENWVISLFIKECKHRNTQVSVEGVLENLEEINKDALALTYVLGLTHHQAADILEIPVETVKAHLHKGIQILSGVEEGHYQEKYIDYLGRTLDRPSKIEFEIHLHNCESCQSSLAVFQATIYSLIDKADAIEVSAQFFDEVKTRLIEIEEFKKKKKQKRTKISIGIASSLILLLLIGYVTNGFAYMHYSWLDWRDQEDEQLLAYLKSGLAEPLNLVQENNGIKVTIKSAIADDFQTLIYYEVENLENSEQYGINFWNGVFVEEELNTFDQQAIPINPLPVQPLESEGNVFKGILSFLPVSSETKTIKLNLSKLQKMEKDAENFEWMDVYGEGSFFPGEWNFEIPVKKKESFEHVVHKKFTVDGFPIEIEKLIIAPTITLLQYRFEQATGDKHINELFFEGIQTKKKKAKPAMFGWSVPIQGGDGQYNTFQSPFDSLYFEKPKEVSLQLSSLYYTENDYYKVEIDMNKPFPQTFDYQGSNISINKVELGEPTKIEITAEMKEGRRFESLRFDVLGRNNSSPMSIGMMDSDGVFVDRNGKIYNRDEYVQNAYMYGGEHPRHYQTEVLLEVYGGSSTEDYIPGWLQIQGYWGTTYLDDKVNIKLK